MSNFNVETVTGVRHWNDNLFSFTTTRDSGFRYLSTLYNPEWLASKGLAG